MCRLVLSPTNKGSIASKDSAPSIVVLAPVVPVLSTHTSAGVPLLVVPCFITTSSTTIVILAATSSIEY